MDQAWLQVSGTTSCYALPGKLSLTFTFATLTGPGSRGTMRYMHFFFSEDDYDENPTPLLNLCNIAGRLLPYTHQYESPVKVTGDMVYVGAGTKFAAATTKDAWQL